MLKKLYFFFIFFILLNPLHAEFSYRFIQQPDGLKIRVGVWNNPKVENSKKLLIICPGRASFIEKNDRLAQHFSDLGFKVVVIDWRGQGGSDRLVENPQKVHIDDYQAYIQDIQKTLEAYHLKDDKIYLVGSSMGAQIVMRFLQDQQLTSQYPIEAAVLLVPMFGLKTNPYPPFIARAAAWIATRLGYQDCYCFGYGDFDPSKDTFERNRNTHDRENFERQKNITHNHPQFITAGPTFGWLYATFQSIDLVDHPKRLHLISTPVFIATAGDDQTVDKTYDASIAANLKHSVHKVYAGSWHNIFNETSEIRQLLLKDVDGFLSDIQD